uniref:Uncharacterized protein n=1 Tax=Avena sativa TaxID=4498 RepID=A0ACD5X3D4_AVESA
MENVAILIVGAGPAGLATAACLTHLSIPYVIVEREDCSASLWRNRAYDRLKLHLAKEFCAENSAENILVIPGLDSFPGEAFHSSRYKSGKSFSGKSVLVIGSGNSGMEIAYDLAIHGANTSIII